MNFRYIDGETPSFLKSFHNKPVRIWSQGDETSLIEFKNQEDRLQFKENYGQNMIFVNNECIVQAMAL